MAFPLDIPSMRLGIRILVGVVLLSVGVSKLMHPRRFRQAIQEYYILPSALDGRFAGSDQRVRERVVRSSPSR